MPIARAAGAVMLFNLAIAVPVSAQDSQPREDAERRHSLSAALTQLRPVGSLGANIGTGYGATGAYLLRLSQTGTFALRVEASYMQYGNESKEVPWSSTIGGRIHLKLSTTNQVIPFSIGPQITWPRGRFRPYANVGIGGNYFFTESDVEQLEGGGGGMATTTNHEDGAFTFVGGGGVYVPLFSGPFIIQLDVGAQYVHGGRSEYLKPGSIRDLDNGTSVITPLQSTTHMLLLRFGLKVGRDGLRG